MSEPSAALYVHFPYCVSICPYCDFDRQATGFESIPRYVEMVARDIDLQDRRQIHSIFFGGGTPSLMSPEQVRLLIDAMSQRFELSARCEITLEANPGECAVGRLRGFRGAGVNRLSIGIQSLDDETLSLLGRRHSADEARSAVGAARAAGFENVSIDLMLGLPTMMTRSWTATLDEAVCLDPDHLSCYILTVDERVPMGRDVAAGRLALPDDDEVAEQYSATSERLAAAGLSQYEVSNWAKPGRQSRHNLTYWRDEPFVGVGAGAAGWLDGVRYKNAPSPRRYMSSVSAGAAERIEEDRPSLTTQIRDFVALGFRLREGLDAGRFEHRFRVPAAEVLGAPLPALLEAGVLESVPIGWRISDAHVLVTSEVIVRLGDGIDAWAGKSAAPGPTSAQARPEPLTQLEQVAASIRG